MYQHPKKKKKKTPNSYNMLKFTLVYFQVHPLLENISNDISKKLKKQSNMDYKYIVSRKKKKNPYMISHVCKLPVKSVFILS